MSQLSVSRRRTIPWWVKVPYTLFVAVLIPFYWRAYGPANFLSFCDAGLLLTTLALWLDSPLLASVNAIALVIPQTVWICDFASGGHLLGFSGYMFNSNLSWFTRFLSTFHIWLPILLIWMLWRLGYDRRAWWVQTLIVWGLLIASYLFTDPRHPPQGYPSPAVNANRVFGIAETKVQTTMPPLVYLGLEMLIFPICVYLPSHLLFKKLFRRAVAN